MSDGAPRLDDVARLAGVSTSTVSRFVTRSGYVAEETGQKIKLAIDALGYVPNLLAGGLASSRSRLVAVLVPGLSQSPFNAMLDALVDALASDGYTPMLGISGYEGAGYKPLIDAALARQADGVILTGVVSDEALRARLRAARTTVIETWGLPSEMIDSAVGFSHEAAGEATAHYLRDRGYRRPVLLSGGGTRAGERRDGFIRAWRESALADVAELEVESPSSFRHGRGLFEALRDLPRMPDVAVCGSDGLAQGLIVEALAAGLSVPGDLAVAGFGNQTIAAAMRPSITTIGIDGARIGQEAAALLSRRASAGVARETARIDVGFKLIARESA